jgi:AraC-like DNA-binding protein
LATSLITTSSVHPRDRFDYWIETARSTLAPFEASPRDRFSFEGEIKAMPFAAGSLTVASSNGLTTWRTPRQIAQSRDTVVVCVQVTGQAAFRTNGREALLRSGDLVLIDSAVANKTATAIQSKVILVEFKRRAVEARLGRLAQWTTRRVDGSNGAGAIVSNFIQSLPRQIPLVSDAAQNQIAHQLIDLFALALTEGESMASAQSSGRLVSLLRLKSVIDANLTNASVTCEDLAASAGISVRYANQLLDDEHTSLQRLLFSRRIAKCQDVLSDPMQMHRQISEIAYSWGFGDVSHFGRLFKSMTGVTPRTFRKQALERAALR